ncbi:hypothetical protein [Rhizobium favelukesii]|uniref:Secreted protein n=1 Tax=Rhizobium favelukesii TaxID=348824 RepID=W6RS83_9HYPH|nr:hypothetical protein [Rhizobium favelukesii]MCS0460855.1 hypothetical protein [Rhizobium favelukesii]CDM57196.1 hypothetical protein LPU83_1524 [Rhizobium favelukesii]
MKLWVLAFSAAIAGATSAAADSLKSGYALCAAIDNSGLASKPCEVSAWSSAVIATVDMDSGEARDVCPRIAGLMKERGASFEAGWTLQIKSPFSNGESIAYCKL